MLKIAIVGPESSGKTVLAEALAVHYEGGLVREISRTYLEDLGRPYEEKDLQAIARSMEDPHGGEADPLHVTPHAGGDPVRAAQWPIRRPTFYDTDTLNLWIWSIEKYGRAHPIIERLVRDTGYTWRLLCRPDIPWEPDPFRENPYDRDRLFAVWEREMRTYGFPYTIIEGTHAQRMQMAISVVDGLREG